MARKPALKSNVVPHPRMQGPIFDTLLNLVSGLGTAKDKTSQTVFTMSLLDRSQLLFAYRGDWIARKIIDAPAQDATREWRDWQAEKTDITKIEDEEKRLHLQFKVKQAIQRARLYGGSALIMGVDQGNPQQELRVDRVRAGSLKYVHVVNRDDISVDQLDRDVTSEYYGEPTMYTVRSGTGQSLQLHPSRVIRFLGSEIPDLNVATDGWGDSTLQSIYDAVIHAGQTAANVATIVHEAKVDVVNIPDMMSQMGSQEYRDRLTERFTLANTLKSITNTLMLDKDEEWNRMTSTFAGLPDLIRIYLLMASGAADIPATRLLGQSASGFNASGQEDTRNYYDRVASDQKNDITPRLDRLDEVMLRSVFGTKPDQTFYEWASLWQLSEQESADVSFKKSQVFTADVNAGLLPPEVMREARENQLIEDGVYPGLERAIEDYGQQNLDEYNQGVVKQMSARAALMAPDNPNNPDAAAAAKKKAVASEFQRRRALPPPRPPAARSQDGLERRMNGGALRRYEPWTVEDETTPRSLYVRRDVLNGEDILAHYAEQGVDVSGVDPESLHVTILYSRQPIDWIKMGEANSYGPSYHEEDPEYEGTDMCVRAGGPRVMEAYGTPPDTLVMCFASSQLTWRHCDMVSRGASEDYEYSPHLSIASWDGTDVRTIEAFQGEIYLGPEIFEPVKVGGAGGVAMDYDPSQPREPAGGAGGGEWTEVSDYSPDQKRDKHGRWTSGGVGVGKGRGRGVAGSRSVSGSRKSTAGTRGAAGTKNDTRKQAALRQIRSLARRLNAAGSSRTEFDAVVADLESRNVTKAQLLGVLADYRLTRDLTYSQRSSKAKLVEALRAEFVVMRRFHRKVGVGGTDGISAEQRERLRWFTTDYSPDQPRVPAGEAGGGQFATEGGAYGSVLRAAGIHVSLSRVKRLESGSSFNAIYKKQPFNAEGNPQKIQVAQQVRGVRGKWNKNSDQGGDFAAASGWLTLKERPELGRLADQFWRDAAGLMTPGEYRYAKSYFATRDTAFTEGFRATYSPNGRAFGLSRARTQAVFGRATEQMRSGVASTLAKPSTVQRVARFFGA
jgi:uncharacterized protein